MQRLFSITVLSAAFIALGCRESVSPSASFQRLDAPAEYEAIDLGSLWSSDRPPGFGMASEALAVNNGGQVVGWSRTGERATSSAAPRLRPEATRTARCCGDA